MNAEGYLSWVDYNVSANQDDLIYASQTATGQVYGSNSKVVFTFNHLLSIVGFTFKSGFDADTDLTISNVTVKGVPSTATFTPDNTETAWQYRRQLERSHRPAELLADDRRDHRGRGQLLRQLLRHSADGALDRGILQRYGNLLGRCAGEQPAFHHDGSDGNGYEVGSGLQVQLRGYDHARERGADYIQFGDPTVTAWTPATDETLPLQ